MSKIGFIHFSDFHIKKTDASFFNESVSKIISAIKNDWLEVQSLYLILKEVLYLSIIYMLYRIKYKTYQN